MKEAGAEPRAAACPTASLARRVSQGWPHDHADCGCLRSRPRRLLAGALAGGARGRGARDPSLECGRVAGTSPGKDRSARHRVAEARVPGVAAWRTGPLQYGARADDRRGGRQAAQSGARVPGQGTHAACEPHEGHPGPARHSSLQTNPAQRGGAFGSPIHAGGLSVAPECRSRTGARHRAVKVGDRPDQATRGGSSTAIRRTALARAARHGSAAGWVVGIGIETADMLVNEVLSGPLRDRRAVARGACPRAGRRPDPGAGLTGAPDESGAKRREQGLAKAGNARVRRGMIQLAWRFLRFQKNSALAQWYQARTADHRGATRKTMIVALARKLLIALWRFVTIGEPLDGVTLRPAS